ncbi:TerD family protein [Rhodococcus sp. C26F]
MGELFTAGRNAPLPTRTVRFTATASVPLDVCAFVVDDGLQVASSDDVVFYNQPTTAGVRLEGKVIVVDVDAVRSGARVLCAVGCERPAAVSTSLSDAAGTVLASFHVEPAVGTETALLCWEIYRRHDEWKIRALGQGYAGGLAEMFTAHGVDVESPSDAEKVAAPGPGPVIGLSPLEVLWRIFEDAARSAAAYTSSVEFAQHRFDDELSTAVADPARRMEPEADRARARAQQRYDELVGVAEARYRDDSAVLAAELLTVDATLPPALASWISPAWMHLHLPSDGVRVGEVTAPDLGPLRIPLCLPAPLTRPLWIDGDPADLGPVVSSVVVRLLTARPDTLLHLVDPGRTLPALETLTAGRLAGPPVHDRSQVPAKLQGLADAADLDALSRQVDADTASPVLLVLAGFPYGYDRDDLLEIVRIARTGSAGRVSVVLAGDPPDDRVAEILWDEAQKLPVDGELADPWTGGRWTFVPDSLPTETEHLRGALGGSSLPE